MRNSSRLSLFNNDILGYLSSFLHLEGPKLVLIEGAATEHQRSDVLATSGKVPNMVFFPNKEALKVHQDKAKTRDLSTYHLIREINDDKEPSYRIGFCKKDGTYATEKLEDPDKKSPLLRYILQYPFILEEGRFRDRELIKYMEEEIIAADGLTFDWLQHFKQLTSISDLSNDDASKAFKKKVREKLVKEIHHRLTFCELENEHTLKAQSLLELDPTVVSSDYRVDVQSCAPELKLLNTTLLEHTLMIDFWQAWNMITDVVEKSDRLTENERTALMLDLANQKKGLKTIPNKVELDTLLHNGLRILDANVLNANPKERQRLEAMLVARHGYHLIIQTNEKKEGQRSVTACELAYCDPKTKEYKKYKLPSDSPLFAQALTLYKQLKEAACDYKVTRAHPVLDLVRGILENKLSVTTRLIQPRARLDFLDYGEDDKAANFTSLLKALENRVEHLMKNVWSTNQYKENWHVTISTLLRLFPVHAWRLWMSDKFPWTLKHAPMRKYVQSDSFQKLEKNLYDDFLFPLPFLLGDKFSAVRGTYATFAEGQVPLGLCRWTVLRSQPHVVFLKSILKVALQSKRDLNNALQTNLHQINSRFVR